MSVTFPRGFRASGVVAGMKPSRRRDLGLLVVDAEASTAGLFTTNAFAAAPVELARKRIVGGSARAVVVNSGQANAGTGSRGLEDAERTTQEVATALGLEPDGVIPCSTGVIGEPIHVEEYLAALPELTRGLSEHGG
ncbi:MAG TPA: bifunctional ornithine acetyltransferase/N-acetylglutamate synthase, partial [Actinomycetota bacterium]|nr:bifunctional ornithine acetyltransferase/N-acetylglutamate synthase [Actinomycetota bacterium]